MHLDLDHNDDWMVDPAELADRLGIRTYDLKRQMADGLVTIRLDPGREEDEGRSRITVRTPAAAWEGIFERDGSLLSERKI